MSTQLYNSVSDQAKSTIVPIVNTSNALKNNAILRIAVASTLNLILTSSIIATKEYTINIVPKKASVIACSVSFYKKIFALSESDVVVVIFYATATTATAMAFVESVKFNIF